MHIFDCNRLRLVRSFPGVRCAQTRLRAAFSPDGSLIVAGSDTGRGYVLRAVYLYPQASHLAVHRMIWNADTGRLLQSEGSERRRPSKSTAAAFPHPVTCVAWHPKQHMIAIGTTGTLGLTRCRHLLGLILCSVRQVGGIPCCCMTTWRRTWTERSLVGQSVENIADDNLACLCAE